MIKILTIIGARPQIIKAAAISRAIKNGFADQITEVIVHTGQHYDQNMSQVFFDELQIPKPDYNLNVGSASHGKQTALMIEGIENLLLQEKPDYLLVYGDTNSTLAGAIAASKIHIPVVHVEAGLRSFNKRMPEEINRIMSDHVSSLLFSPTQAGYKNLLAEGFKASNQGPYSNDNPGIFHCGDIMYDNSLFFSSVAEKQSSILSDNELEEGKYILTTIHRDNNTDIPERLNQIFSALYQLSNKGIKVVLPLHPRTSKLLENNLDAELLANVKGSEQIVLLPPVSFLEMIMLEKHSKMIITDSGGVQKEAYFFNKPCVIMRPETEWVELIENGTALIADADEQKILSAFNHFESNTELKFPDIFGDGHAAEFICNEIIKNN